MAIDLFVVAKSQAWRKLWVSLALTVGGVVLSVLGLAVGFIVFFGLALVLAGIIAFFGALAAITDPTRGLSYLGPNEVLRRQVLRTVDGELSQPSTSTLRTIAGGTALLGPCWLAYHDKSTLVVTRREDVLWFYVETKKSNQVLKMHLRSGTVAELEMTHADQHLLHGFAYALPHAITGWDPGWAAVPLPALAYEVDRRRYALG